MAELALEKPVLSLVRAADGYIELPALPPSTEPKKPEPETKPTEPLPVTLEVAHDPRHGASTWSTAPAART